MRKGLHLQLFCENYEETTRLPLLKIQMGRLSRHLMQCLTYKQQLVEQGLKDLKKKLLKNIETCFRKTRQHQREIGRDQGHKLQEW